MKRVQAGSQGILWVLSVLASRIYLGVFFGLALWAFLPMVIQWQSTVVISGSMEPTVSTGDVLVAQTYSQEEIAKGVVKVGDVTLAENPDKPGSLITHRVIEILDNGDFKTKGDANKNSDSTPVPKENVVGVERILVPYVGLPLQTLRAGDPVPAAIFVLLTMLAQMIVYKDIRIERAFAKAKADEDAAGDTDSSPKGNKKVKVAAALGGVVAATALVTTMIPAVAPTAFSQAAFSASIPSGASSFAASMDWTPPTASMVTPSSPLKGTVDISANASDDKSGISKVVIQYQASGAGTWTNLCTVTVAPYTCPWTTTAVTDGIYDLRAVSTDKAGYSTTSATVQTTIANKMLVILSAPKEFVKGTVALSTTLYNTGTVNYSVRVEYSPSGANSWKSICTGLTAPYNCSWNTATYANGDYDLRSVAVSGSTTFTSAQQIAMVDNLVPTVSMVDPTSPISGHWTFSATASDAHSGVTQVTLQYAFNGSTTYTDFCTFTATPYSCRIDTRTFANGTYSFRAVADDAAGNRTISTPITNKVIDNTVSSVSMEDPGAFLTGNVALKALANSTAGVSSVVIQMASNGSSNWTTLCTFTSEPYTCLWNTATVANGPYSFRAVLTDSRGVVTTSATVTNRQVDNLPLRGFDVQPASGTGTVGRIDTGDAMAFTYTTQVNLSSVSTGWDGTAIPVTVRIQDGALAGLDNTTDAMDIQRSGSAVNLGFIDLRQNYIKNQKTVLYNATMASSTVTVNGVAATKITVTLGTLASGNLNTLRPVSNAGSVIWTPSNLVTDLYGKPASVAPITESGNLDRDF